MKNQIIMRHCSRIIFFIVIITMTVYISSATNAQKLLIQDSENLPNMNSEVLNTEDGAVMPNTSKPSVKLNQLDHLIFLQPNGCGAANGGLNPPDDYFIYDFEPACNNHDICYGTMGVEKSTCDNQFLIDLVSSCPPITACIANAYTYHYAVVLFGSSPYDTGQSDTLREVAEYYNLAMMSFGERETYQAVNYYKKILEYGNDPYIYYLIGNVYYATREDNEALANYSKAIEYNSSIPVFYYARGNLYNLRGNIQLALEDYRHYVELVGEKNADPQILKYIESNDNKISADSFVCPINLTSPDVPITLKNCCNMSNVVPGLNINTCVNILESRCMFVENNLKLFNLACRDEIFKQIEQNPNDTQLTNLLTPTSCEGSLAPSLIVGQQGRVRSGLGANNLRNIPSTSGTKIGQIPEVGIFQVIDGPECADGFTWWQVDYNGTIGWTVEGDNSEYWLEPFNTDQSQIDNPSTNIESDIVGYWIWVVDGVLDENNDGIEFSANGTFSVGIFEGSIKGTYTFIGENEIRLSGESCGIVGCNPVSWETEVTISGNRIILDALGSGDDALLEKAR